MLYLWSGNAHITDAITQTKLLNTTQHNARTEHAATADLSSEAEEDTTDAIPQLLILGDHDNFTSVITFRDIVATMDDTTTTGIVLGNTDHFFRNKEHSILTAIGTYPCCISRASILVSENQRLYQVLYSPRLFILHYLSCLILFVDAFLMVLLQLQLRDIIIIINTTTTKGDWIVDEFSNCSDGDVIGALRNIIGQVRPIDPTEQNGTGSDRRATNLSYTS